MYSLLADFHWLRPQALWLLIPTTLLFCYWYSTQSQQKSSWEKVCDPHLLKYLLIQPLHQQSKYRFVVVGLVFLFIILALAGPTVSKKSQPLFKKTDALVILFDLSTSMYAQDVKPNRLQHAIRKTADILNQRQEGETALIGFAGEAFVITPFTEDTETIYNLLNELEPDVMPVQGDNLLHGLSLASELLGRQTSASKRVILITDGIDNTQLNSLKTTIDKSQLQLDILVTGGQQGSPIRLSDGTLYKNKHDEIVLHTPDLKLLKQLAVINQGKLLESQADNSDIIELLQSSNSHDRNTSQKMHQNTNQWHDQGYWLVILALPFLAWAYRYVTVLCLVGFLWLPSQSSHALTWKDLWQTKDQQAYQAYKNQSFDQAQSLFTDKQWQGTNHFRKRDYQTALELFSQNQTEHSVYNQANTLAHLHQFEEAISLYEQVLAQNPAHQDAKHNKQLIEELLQQQQQQKQNNSENDPTKESSQQNSQQNQENNQAQNHNQQQINDSETQQNQQENEHQQNTQQQVNNEKAETEQQNSNEEPFDEMANENFEEEQAKNQWLQRIPDDPGGLLRRKLLWEYQQRQQQ